jgi:AcrR family transcriptional regulator
MNSISTTGAKRKSKITFIEEVRRRQILEIAIQEITAKGYRNTTIPEIAKRAEVSKGVIYYHFNGKQDLLQSIWSTLVDELHDYRRTRVERHDSPKARLQAYFEANFEFLENNWNKFAALFSMGIEIGSADAKPNPWSRETNLRCLEYLSGILRQGQARGEFGRFEPSVIATIIQGAIDGLLLQVISDPSLYALETCKRVLREVIERYTCVQPNRREKHAKG